MTAIDLFFGILVVLIGLLSRKFANVLPHGKKSETCPHGP